MNDFSNLDYDRDFLMWIHERLQNVHGEKELYDYMHRLRCIIANIPDWRVTPNDGRGTNGLETLKQALITQKAKEIEDEREYTEQELEDLGLSSCEQCDETAFDGRICHACGLKII